MWLLSGEMSVQLDYSLRIEGTTTQYSNTLLTRNARPLPCHISNLAQVLLHKMNWTMQIKTMRRFLSNKIIWTGGVTSMYNWCPVRCLSKWPTPPLLFSSRPLHWNWWTHTQRWFPTNRHFTFLTKRNIKNTASFELNTIKYFLYSYFFHYNLAQGEWAKKINSGSDLNVLKMIWTDTADPYLFALVIKIKRNPFYLSTHELTSKSVWTKSAMFDNTFVAVMM